MAEQFGDISDEQVQAMTRSILDGGTFRELKGISNEELETIYAMGVDYYKAGNFADAAKLFRFLVFLDHTSSRFWTAHGSALQAQKQYEKAIKCYQLGTFFDLHNPKPAYYAAECFVSTGDLENAARALNTLDMYAPKDTDAGRRFLAKGKELRAKIEAV